MKPILTSVDEDNNNDDDDTNPPRIMVRITSEWYSPLFDLCWRTDRFFNLHQRSEYLIDWMKIMICAGWVANCIWKSWAMHGKFQCVITYYDTYLPCWRWRAFAALRLLLAKISKLRDCCSFWAVFAPFWTISSTNCDTSADFASWAVIDAWNCKFICTVDRYLSMTDNAPTQTIGAVSENCLCYPHPSTFDRSRLCLAIRGCPV